MARPPPPEMVAVANAVSLLSAIARDPASLEQTLSGAAFWKAIAEATSTCLAFAAKTGRVAAEPPLEALRQQVRARKRPGVQTAAAAAVAALGLG